MAEDRMLSDEILLALIKKNSGGGGGGTNNYNQLENKPQIGGVTLQGNKSLEDLGIKNEFIGTKAQWNALTAEQRKAYDTYQFTDDFMEGRYIYLPTIYSEEEKQVGVWKNGKPLFQKNIPLTSSLANGSWNNEFLGTKGSGISIKNFCGLVYGNSFPNLQFPINYYRGTSEYVACIISDDGDDLNILPSLHDIGTLYIKHITIQYTRNSDAPGSGIWTPSGEIAHHYSTDDQMVGTWVDGSTMWEKTIDFGALPNTGSKQVATGLTNVKVRKIDANSRRSSDGFAINIPHATTGGVQYQVSVNYNNGNIDISAGVDMTAFDETYVTIQYTKTA